jgi:hypothetical protein
VREDESVSLGWCFWHKGCFGCLICGQPINLDVWLAAEPADRYKASGHLVDEMEEILNNRVEKSHAVEIDEVPTCKHCTASLEKTRIYRDEVELFLAKSTVRRRDGGVGDARWDKLRRANSVDINTGRQLISRRGGASESSTGSDGHLRSGSSVSCFEDGMHRCNIWLTQLRVGRYAPIDFDTARHPQILLRARMAAVRHITTLIR